MLCKAIKYVGGIPSVVEDSLVQEEALQIRINERPYTITMRTPGQDEYLSKGLLYTEHVIEHRHDITDYRETPSTNGTPCSSVDVTISRERLQKKYLYNRTLVSSSSCGMCGKTEMDDSDFPSQPLEQSPKLDICLLERMQQMMAAEQALFHETGGCHAAAAFTTAGKLLVVMEDIGRHNAVDKVIGYLLENELLDVADIMSVSGRVSYEIVTKAHAAQIPLITSVSAPSTLAVKLCDSMGMTLISFCRGNKATVYTHDSAVIGARRELEK